MTTGAVANKNTLKYFLRLHLAVFYAIFTRRAAFDLLTKTMLCYSVCSGNYIFITSEILAFIMANETKIIQYDANGAALWISIEMTGLYFVTYTCQLWSADETGEPILSKPIKSGTNKVAGDDFYQVLNDLNPADVLAAYDGRVLDIRFWVKKGTDDNGYRLKATLLQGAAFNTAQALGNVEVTGKNKTQSIKEEFITIQLKK